jgi:hypothetical protein
MDPAQDLDPDLFLSSSSSFIYHKPPDITGYQGLKTHF